MPTQQEKGRTGPLPRHQLQPGTCELLCSCLSEECCCSCSSSHWGCLFRLAVSGTVISVSHARLCVASFIVPTCPWTQLFHSDTEHELGVRADKLKALIDSWEWIYLNMDFLSLSFLRLLLYQSHKILINSYLCYGKIATRKRLPRLSASDIKVKNMLKNWTKHYELVEILFCMAQKAMLKL